MLCKECLIDLGNIAQKISSGIERIFPYASCLSSESGELVCNFGELHICLRWYLLYHDHRLEADPSAVSFEFLHLLPYEFRSDVKYMAKSKSVEILDFLRCHEEIVRHLVSYKDFSVPVMDDASGRIYRAVYHGVVLSVHLVLVLKNLDAEKLGNQDGCCCAETYQKFVFPVEIHLRPPIFCRPE